MRKTAFLTVLCVAVLAGATMLAQDTRVRTPLRIPDILGYRTLKCDFHVHTVFSDGSVWPTTRVDEAWREGLDAIAITDHVEYLPHKDDLGARHNRSFEIARPGADVLPVMVIKGAEITRPMPPGHLNAIFLEDSAALDTGDDWRAALREARRQGAFVFWNHPGWKGQQPDGVARWYPEHTELLEAGLFQGIEVVNEREYYPQAYRWALEKKLTILSDSDIHDPTNLFYDIRQGDHRPMTLVFARDASAAGIREALVARRTAAWSGRLLVGEEQFLRPIFTQSVAVLNPSIELTGTRAALLQIENRSDLEYELVDGRGPAGLTVPSTLVLRPGRVVLLALRVPSVPEGASGTLWEKDVTLSYRVANLRVTPDEGLAVTLAARVKLVAPGL